MSKEFSLSFISQENFERHVAETIKQYKNVLKSINLKKFNRNIIDPIKLIFDKNVFNKSYEEVIQWEINRKETKLAII
ncbi:hypothetical protein MBOVa_5130 [Mycoplasmopsis bovis 8790]|nr:hypothetical protein MBOVa_5130 [Mycoplasmopsis bovis 8790]